MSAEPRQPEVAVIIAVKDGARWIARSVSSALAQARTGQVIVVDDGSSDGTAEVARSCDDGTGRLSVLRFEINRGPSAARNAALEAVTTPYAAILDADDFLLPHRFDAMFSLGGDDWDFLADDLLLLPDMLLAADPSSAMTALAAKVAAHRSVLGDLGAAAFVRGNISRPGKRRRELGFLKPVMKMSFLRGHGLRYDETLRLGEDYALYAQALIAGARFRLLDACGYVAVDRGDSLSSRHRTSDHAQMVVVDSALMELASGQGEVVDALREHRAAVRRKLDHRVILEIARERGRLVAALSLLRMPGSAWHILTSTAKAKLGTRAVDAPEPTVRLLIGTAGLP